MQNKVFGIVIICGFLIIGVVYFVDKKEEVITVKSENKVTVQNNTEQKCNFAQEVLVTKVIDGDTIVVEGGNHIRLIGIDSDEFGYPCFESAKKELENLVLNKKVILQKDISVTDKYGRCLNYVFVGDKNINIEMVSRGLAVAVFYEPDTRYKVDIQNAETQAIASKNGCKWVNLK
jgi:micrococcal nuclease